MKVVVCARCGRSREMDARSLRRLRYACVFCGEGMLLKECVVGSEVSPKRRYPSSKRYEDKRNFLRIIELLFPAFWITFHGGCQKNE